MTVKLEDDNYKLPTIVQGTDWTFAFTWKTQTGTDPPVAVDLTGYSALFQLRRSSAHPPVISLSQGSGITLGGAAGTIQIDIANTLTEEIVPAVYKYDLRLTSPGGQKRVILAGEVELRARISR